jgi:hypothetical protein
VTRIALVAAASLLGGCGGCGDPSSAPDAGVDPFTYDQCDSDTEAWVKNAYLAIVGHRPRGQAEVDVYVALHDQIAALAEADATAIDPKAAVAAAMAAEPGYLARWTSHFLDALRVPRVDDQAMEECYGERRRASPTDQLAAHVRDHPPTAAGPGGAFTLLDLVESALVLDDVTPIYRGHLFALVNFPIPAANVPPVEAELARREDFGQVFDSAYLNRDLVCLQCHNSQVSVTDHDDPELDRHWPLAGLFEASLYGASSGIDAARAHAVFRFDGFAAGPFGDGPRRPWSWSSVCGSFSSAVGDDPAGIEGRFGGLSGRRLTVYDLDAALARGVDALRGGALIVGGGGEIAEPDHALAFLVAATIVEGVWKEVVGTGLTISNYFPRNAAMRDTLDDLTSRFIASGYSVRALVTAIVSSDWFSRRLPEEACGDGPYAYPNVYDPWVISDDDEARRGNGPGDAVAAVSARTLIRTAHAALEWAEPGNLDFPPGDGGFCVGLSCPQLENACQFGFCCDTFQAQCFGEGGGTDELGFQQGIGAFLKNGDRGFRGLDFQARLVWEDRFAGCADPAGGDDFIDQVIAAAAARADATVGDVIVAVKDRLIGEPGIDPAREATALAELFGGPLDRPASTVADLEARTRQLCGVLLSSPQFVLSGVAGRGGEVPRLTPPAWQSGPVCERVAPRIEQVGVAVACDGGEVTVTAGP